MSQAELSVKTQKYLITRPQQPLLNPCRVANCKLQVGRTAQINRKILLFLLFNLWQKGDPVAGFQRFI